MEAAVQYPFGVMFARCSEDGAMCARTCVLFSSNCSVRHFCRLTLECSLTRSVLAQARIHHALTGPTTQQARVAFTATRSRPFVRSGIIAPSFFGWIVLAQDGATPDLFRQGVLDLGLSAARRLRESHSAILALPPQGASESPTQFFLSMDM